MANPVNPNIFSFDIEATQLPKNFHAAQKLGEPFRLPPLDDILSGFAHVDIFQLAYIRGDNRQHIDVTDTQFSRPEMSAPPLKRTHEYIGPDGKPGTYKKSISAVSSRKSYDKLFKSSANMMTENATERYKRDVLPHYVQAGKKNTQYILENGGAISAMPFEDILTSKSYEEVRAAAQGVGFDYTGVSQDKFLGKGEGSLFSVIDDLMKSGSSSAPATLRSWNTSYDVPAIIATLHKSGHYDLVERFINQHNTGLLKIEGIEKEWHEVLWKLLGENKDIAGDIKIGMHPMAAAVTSRPGQTVRNLDEFRFSSYSWSQDDVAKYFAGHKDMAAIQHLASTDIAQSETFNKIMKSILEDARKNAGANNIHELLAMKDTGNAFTDAFQTMIDKNFTAHNKLGARETIRELADAAHGKDRWAQRNFASFFAADTSKKLRHKWGKYPGVIGATAAIVAATYLGSGDSSMDLSSDGTRTIGGIPIGRGIGSSVESDGGPHIGTNMTDYILGLGTPVLTAAGIGYGAAQRNPVIGGRKPVMPTNVKEANSQFWKTVRYGVKSAEGQFPLLRVFELGSLSDYFFGSKKYIVTEAGEGIGGKAARWHKVDVVKRVFDKKTGDYVKSVTQSAEQHGTDMTKFLDELKGNNPQKHKQLTEALNPNFKDVAPEKVPQMRQLRIASTNTGKTIVQWEDFTFGKAGKEQRVKQASVSMILDQKTIFGQLRSPDPQAARIDSRSPLDPFTGKRVPNKSSMHVNTAIHEYASESLIDGGVIGKDSFDDYLKRLVKPGFVQNNPFMEPAWEAAEKMRWRLDLNSKGLGEAANSLMPGATERIARTKTTLMVDNFAHKTRVPGAWLVGNMDKFLETPFEFLGVDSKKIQSMANNLKSSQSVISNVLGKTLSAIEKPHLGLGYANHRGSVGRYLGMFGLKRVLPAIAAIEAFRFTDHVLGGVTQSDTGRGPLTTLPIKAFETADLMYTKMSDITGLTDYAKWQADVAPGSTGIGFLAPAATATASYFMLEQMYKKGPDPIGRTLDAAGKKMASHPLIKSAMQNEAYAGARGRGPAEKFLAYALRNPKKALFAAAMLPSLPFLPGFIGSDKNYAEKKAEYKGEKEVEIRKYRGWLLSSSPFEGTKVRSWRRHSLNLIESDFENRGVLYPSYWDRFAHNVTLGLYKPNILEEYHKNAQPVYKSAAWGSNVPLIGPVLAATLGKVIGQKTYHEPGQYASEGVQELAGEGVGIDAQTSMAETLRGGSVKRMFGDEQTKIGYMVGLRDPSSLTSLSSRFADSMADLSGFRGFSLQTLYSRAAGQYLPDQYTPYAQDSSQMYAAAEQMWQYNLGDITVVGGEFLRRILQNSEKRWEVNDIPNELSGVSWIPQGDQGYGKDITHGTTFNKVDMGWLYGSRKGWEFLYGEETAGGLENYDAPVRTEILQQIAPYSREFDAAANSTLQMALGEELDPEREQRFYDTLEQVSQVKEKLYATQAEYTYELETESVSGDVEELDADSGSFRMGGQQYQIAGVSLQDVDIRARLLQKQTFETAAELSEEVAAIKQRTEKILVQYLSSGVSAEIASSDMLADSSNGIEAQISGLSEALWDAGAPFANTGNLSTHNQAQDRVGMAGTAMAGYWDSLTGVSGYWNKKLINKRDYIDNYTTNQVFNREVKLWTRPIDHILKPFVASTLHNWFGIDSIPSFTKERRNTQQYWDVLKYIKYRSLSTKAMNAGDSQSAAYYESQWRTTQVGADPTDASVRDELQALPASERQYFDYISNEPDPERRADIFKYLPEASKRIYSNIWLKKMAATTNDSEILSAYENMKASEGWSLTEEEEEEYHNTGGGSSKGDWARSRFVQKYAEENDLPGPEWSGWSEDVSLENAQVLSIMEQGENVQDYGYFDNKIREAVYDDSAHRAALNIEAAEATGSKLIGSMNDLLLSDMSNGGSMMPTMSSNPVNNVNIESDQYDRILRRNSGFAESLLPLDFLGL